MTFIVPNYFLDEKPNAIVSSDSFFTLAYSSRKTNEKILIRNTMHSMILVLNGTKKVSSTLTNFEVLAKDIFFLKQGNYIMSEIVDNQGAYEALLVYFDDDFMMRFINKYSINFNNAKKNEICAFSADRLLSSLIDSISLYIHQNVEQKNEILKLKVEEIFLHLLSEHKREFTAFLHAIKSTSKERIRYILEANIDMITSVEDMCKITRLSKGELRKETQKLFGLQPKAWFNQQRLEEASILLQNSDDSISSIAIKCGFATSSWFGVQFKKQFSLTPREYREQNR